MTVEKQPDGLSRLNMARAHPLHGETGDFSRVFQMEFFFNVCPVSFHRLRAEMQKLRNLMDVVAFADQFQNLKFAITKSLDGVGLHPRTMAIANFVITCAAIAGLR